MKILLLSITAGEGHNVTGKALLRMMSESGHKCFFLDTFDYLSPFLKNIVDRGYLISTRSIPKIYRRCYNAVDQKRQNTNMDSLGNRAAALAAGKLYDFVRDVRPDCILCTHVFPAQILNALKASGRLKSIPVIGVMTDYTIHPFWPDIPYIEYFTTASELLNNEARRKGMDLRKIRPLGIPIHPKFAKTMDKGEARELLGVKKDLTTVLFMGGSMGYGRMDRALMELDRLGTPFQIISVCGNNHKMKHSIDRLNTRHKLYNHGFVNNVDVMMDAADCIITKPGGLTTSEALAKKLPMVIANAIPGQEEHNIDFLVNNGLAVRTTRTYPLSDAIYQLFYYPEKLRSMAEATARLGKPNASADICGFVTSLGARDNG